MGAKHQLQFIATSATLVTPQENVNVEEIIKETFTSKIFPDNNKPFSIQLGTTSPISNLIPEYSVNYSDILRHKGVELKQENEYDFKLPFPSEKTLFAQFKWLKEAKNSLQQYNGLEQLIKEDIALGDIVHICRVCSNLLRNKELSFSYLKFQTALVNFKTSQDRAKRLIKEAAHELNQEIEDGEITYLSKVLRGRLKETPIFKCHYFPIFATCLLNILSEYDTEEIPNVHPLTWTIQLTGNSANELRTIPSKITKWRCYVTYIEKEISQAWQRLLQSQSLLSIEEMIGNYLLKSKEVSQLLSILAHAPHIKYDELARIVTPSNYPEDFDSLCQLLAVSKSNENHGKPIVDLRFHQSVEGLHSISISFNNEKNEIIPHLNINDSAAYDANGNRAYELACCHHCAHPFILVYAKAAQLDKIINSTPVSRYRHGAYTYLHALTWIYGNNTPAKKDKSRKTKRLWLEYKKGLIHLSMNVPDENRASDFLCIEHFTSASKEDTNHINECPACESKMHKGGEYTLIAPYRLSDDQARVLILRAMADTTDNDFFAKDKPADGKRLLAFSDSRNQAARLPILFDELSEQKLLDYSISHCLQSILPDENGVFNLSIENANNGNLIGPIIKKIKDFKAYSLLEKKYFTGINRETVEYFSEKASVAQRLIKNLRNASHRALERRRYLSFKSNAIINRIKDADIDEAWDDYISACNNDNTHAEIFFYEVYRYLFLKCQLSFAEFDPIKGEYYELDYRNWNDSFSYTLGVEIKETGDSNVFAFYKTQNKVSARLEKWIKSIWEGNANISSRDITEALFNLLKTSYILIENKNKGDSYLFNVADLRLCKGTNKNTNLLVEDNNFYRIEEHSGQLSKEIARHHQKLFSEGHINILSCSTTFEMGVDLGNLNDIFLCNMPPTVSNYRQRAGRAGRRAGSSAYVLTYLGESSHDSNYRNDPAKLFFSDVPVPLIYENISSYRAKHLRAVALHNFLLWCKEKKAVKGWKTNQSFFANPEKPQEIKLVSYLDSWYEECASSVQTECEIITNAQIDYIVAADLCFQLTGKKSKDLKNYNTDEGYKELAGPCQQRPDDQNMDYWKSCALSRFLANCNEFNNDQYILKRLGREDTPGHLASIRVLPRYGFPCDVIEMYIEGKSKEVRLMRDKSIGISEYAPGNIVYANKKKFLSKEAKFLGFDNNHKAKASTFIIYKCKCCNEIYLFDKPCPHCHSSEKYELTAMQPDYFRGIETNDKTFSTSRIEIFYGGDTSNDTKIEENTNLQIYSSNTRELLYINFLDNKKPQYDALIHTLRTDIVLWQAIHHAHQKEIQKPQAWNAALQAILKAAAEVLNINRKDISGIVSKDKLGNYILVIYDSSSSGSGSVIPLLPGKQNANKEVDILKLALSICEGRACKCGILNEREKLLEAETDTIVAENAGKYRPYRSCYHCLQSYTNRHMHATLDAYEASVILKHLLYKSK